MIEKNALLNESDSSFTFLNCSTKMNRNFRNVFIAFAYLLQIGLLVGCFITFLPSFSSQHNRSTTIVLPERHLLDHLPEIQISNTSVSHPSQTNCTYYTCFDVYKCSHTHTGKIKVCFWVHDSFIYNVTYRNALRKSINIIIIFHLGLCLPTRGSSWWRICPCY